MRGLAACFVLVLVGTSGCATSADVDGVAGSGVAGGSDTGGMANGGAASTGGAPEAGGAATTGGANPGGAPGSGGTLNTGGTPSTGGAPNSGGTSSGGANTGGTGGTAAAGTGGARLDAVPPGTWQDISPGPGTVPAGTTPPSYGFASWPGGNYGFLGLDGAKPDQPKTLYLGTCGSGIWKTTDGGDHWFKASTGANGTRIGNVSHTATGLPQYSGRAWALTVDPNNSNTVYVVVGYGDIGLYKSTNGGVDWTKLGVNVFRDGNDLSNVDIDPTDHLHLIAAGKGPSSGTTAGLYESFDGGQSWPNVYPAPNGSWQNNFDFFLGRDDAGAPSGTYVLIQTQSGGYWRTSNLNAGPAGVSWTQVTTTGRAHGGGGLARASNGHLFAASQDRVLRSTDNGRTWAVAGNIPKGEYAGIKIAGGKVFAMPMDTGLSAFAPVPTATFPGKVDMAWMPIANGGSCNPSTDPCLSAGTTTQATPGFYWFTTDETDGIVWTQYNAQSFNDGPFFQVYDRANSVLYSSNWSTGVFRLKMK